MSWLSHLSVRAKLALLIGVFSLGMLAVCMASLWGLRQAVNGGRALVDSEVSAVGLLGDVRSSVGRMRRFEKDLFLNLAEEDSLHGFHAAWGREVQSTQDTLQRLDAHLQGDEKGVVVAMVRALGVYRQQVDGIVKGVETGLINDPWAANKALAPVLGELEKLDQGVETIRQAVDRRVVAVVADLDALERMAMTRTLAAAFGVFVAALVLGLWVAVRITRPLAEAAVAMERVAGGDLTGTVTIDGSDEVARLLQGIRQMQGALVAMVGNIRDGAGALGQASREIAAGNIDLSTRTEEAASRLQATAASVEQVNGTVLQSADAAQRAHLMAVSNADIAERGGRVVSDVVATMEAIQRSSQKIGDITGVIDSIAFQTNILALNAAVEAARAGEQGRGFAVVAAEVRNLAQRSAEAAKAIKQLIGDSVTQVEAGTRLVAEAGGTIGDIVVNAGQVSALISEITGVAQGQRLEMSQVTLAIGQLDHMTQQNAALVEESAAAAESLKMGAERLERAVAAFRL